MNLAFNTESFVYLILDAMNELPEGRVAQGLVSKVQFVLKVRFLTSMNCVIREHEGSV